MSIESLVDAILAERVRRDRNTDEAAQPSEVVDLTEAEVLLVKHHHHLHSTEFAPASHAAPARFLGMDIRVVEHPGPCRIHSRAEIWLEVQRDAPTYFTISTGGSGNSWFRDRFFNKWEGEAPADDRETSAPD